jgi:hypothetical protein
MKLAEKTLALFEANLKQRKIKQVDIERLTITVTWAATDQMDNDSVKEFPVTGDLEDLVHIFLDRETNQSEKRSAREKILKKILQSR